MISHWSKVNKISPLSGIPISAAINKKMLGKEFFFFNHKWLTLMNLFSICILVKLP